MKMGDVLSRMSFVAVVAFAANVAHAQIFTVDVNTSSIVNDSNGPYYIDFQLNAGPGSTAVTNTVTINDFSFIGGTEHAGVTVSGDVADTSGPGGIVTSVTLNADGLNENENEAAIRFSSTVTNIIFTVDLTQVAGAVSPDQFIVDMLDGTTNNIATNAPNGTSLLQVNVTGTTTPSNLQTYVSTTTANAVADGGSGGVYIVGTPEPSTWAMLMGGLGLLVCWGARQRRA